MAAEVGCEDLGKGDGIFLGWQMNEQEVGLAAVRKGQSMETDMERSSGYMWEP